ncbi:thiamine phosphate synthase [Burkholderiaceae bacterium DAT-1]|nr:thiamine phosphate synthase [Burkholderiaceae bacterium DAT-1]
MTERSIRPRLRPGLYAITPDWTDTVRLLAAVEIVLANGASVLQYRNKAADADLRMLQASALRAVCYRFNCPLIINDHVDLALAVDADGVHLGGDDGDLAAARAVIGPYRLLGASCYNDLWIAASALAAGADHIAFGAIFPSATKPQARAASLDILAHARKQFACPIVGIGGIQPENSAKVRAAGADLVAVISALFEAKDLAATTCAFAA